MKTRTDPEDRTEKLLALLLLQQARGSSQRDRTKLLNLAGFSNLEIADLLETTPAVVSSNLYASKSAKKKKKKTRTGKK